MSQLQPVFDKLKVSDEYEQNSRILTVWLNYFSKLKKPVLKEDLAAITGFIFDEMERLIILIPKTSDYKTKDEIFAYEDKLLGLFTLAAANKCDITESNFETVKTLVNLVNKEQVLETAIDEVFKLEKIEKTDIIKVLDIAKSLTDEYQRGMFFQGLLHYQKNANKFTDDAKAEVAEYIGAEFERYLQKKDNLSEVEIDNLEIASDVCQSFINGRIIGLLKEIVRLKYNDIRYYAIATLLLHNQKIEPGLIAEMAADLTYADLTYSLLKHYNQTSLFPKEFKNVEYLAKSDMVHWLTYPTELGKTPDAIELLGSVKAKGAIYYVFKYKSDSDNLDDDLKNEWLIGWSSNDGGTFSNFDKLALFEQKNPEKTLNFIKKKLLG